MCGLAYSQASVGEGWFHRAERGLQSEPSAALPMWPSSHGCTTNTHTQASLACHLQLNTMIALVRYRYLAHLALRSQPGLLQPGPNALDPACMFWVIVGVSAHTLVLLHQRVIHQAYRGIKGQKRQKNIYFSRLNVAALLWLTHQMSKI